MPRPYCVWLRLSFSRRRRSQSRPHQGNLLRLLSLLSLVNRFLLRFQTFSSKPSASRRVQQLVFRASGNAVGRTWQYFFALPRRADYNKLSVVVKSLTSRPRLGNLSRLLSLLSIVNHLFASLRTFLPRSFRCHIRLLQLTCLRRGNAV